MSKKSFHSINFGTSSSQLSTFGIKSIFSRCTTAVSALSRTAFSSLKSTIADSMSLVARGEDATAEPAKSSLSNASQAVGNVKPSTASTTKKGKRVIVFNEKSKSPVATMTSCTTWCGTSAVSGATSATVPFAKQGKALFAEQSPSPLARIEASRPVAWLAANFSNIFEEKVSPRRALHLLHAHIAVLFLIIPADFPLSMRALFLVWAIAATFQCRR